MGFWPPSFWGLSTVDTKSLIPSSLRPWCYLWTTPKKETENHSFLIDFHDHPLSQTHNFLYLSLSYFFCYHTSSLSVFSNLSGVKILIILGNLLFQKCLWEKSIYIILGHVLRYPWCMSDTTWSSDSLLLLLLFMWWQSTILFFKKGKNFTNIFQLMLIHFFI